MSDRNYGAIRDVEVLEKFVNQCIQSGKPIGFDIEAGYSGPDGEKLALRQYHPQWLFTGFSFTVSEDWARYVPVNHDSGGNVDDVITTARLLWRLVMSGKIVAHNAMYELTGVTRWLREVLWNDPLVGEEIRATRAIFPILDDTMILVWLTAEYDPLRIGKDLKSVALAAFGLEMTHYEDLYPYEDSEMGPAIKKGKIRFSRFNTRNSYSKKVIDYACEDAVATLMIHNKHYAQWAETFVFKFEMGLQPVMHEMERGPVDPDTGAALGNLLLDWPTIHAKAKECAEFRDKMGEEIQTMLGERLGRLVEVNLSSIPQMRKILYDEAPDGLGLPVEDKFRSEKTNEPSTSDDALRVLAKDDEIIRKILDYRQVVKLYGSYLHKFEMDLEYSGTGVVFPNHNQAGALTGRMSVDHVSYQQWPKPYHFALRDGTTFDFNFRNIMIAPDGYRVVGFDFSQIELRVLAGQAQETAMLKAFADGIDIHKATASTMLRIDLSEVTKKQRSVGKAQPLYSKILTPTGWSTMGEMTVGTKVIGSDGRTITVDGVFPQGVRDVYRVTLSDGATVDMDGEHLLTVRNTNTKNAPWVTKTLNELMRSGLRQGTKRRRYTEPKYELPARPVVHYDPVTLPIDPYFLGLLLGDGGFRHDWAAYYCTADEELAQYVRDICPQIGVKCDERGREDGLTIFYFPSVEKGSPNPLTRALKDLGLWGVHGSEKFIPEVYLRATPEDRLALLQGIMDTDGSVQYSGANLRVTSKALVEGVQEISRSLGGNATHSVKNSRSAKTETPLPTHRTQVALPADVCPFRLSRKAQKIRPRLRRNQPRIFSAELVGAEEVQCIHVDSFDSLYLTDGHAVVHNTCNFAVVYGSGPANIADMLTAQGSPTTKEQAVELLDLYYAGFSNLRAWMDKKILEGREQGYVETMFGRKFTVWEYRDHRDWIRSKGDRMCVNAPIQGGAADYLKIGMNRVRRAIHQAEADGLIPVDSVRLVMTVHDALEFYVRDDVDTQTVVDLINPCVTPRLAGLPDIRADWHEGNRWGLVVELVLDDDKKIVGYEWEDPDGASHEFETLEEAYAFQDSYFAAKTEILSEQSLAEKIGRSNRPAQDRAKPMTGAKPDLGRDSRDALRRKKGIATPDDYSDLSAFGFEDEPHPFFDGGEDDGCRACSGHEEDAVHKRDVVDSHFRAWQAANTLRDIAPAPVEPEKTAVIRIQEMPDADSWEGFQEWLATQQGKMTVKLETPEGSIEMDIKAQLDESDQGMISLLLGGASLDILTEAVDVDLAEVVPF